MKTEVEKLKRAYTKWNSEGDFAFFGTIKFLDGWRINDYIVRKRACYFFNMLDRKVLGQKTVRQGIRLRRMVYMEKGKSRENRHIHFYTKGITAKQNKEIIKQAHKLFGKVTNAYDLQIVGLSKHERIAGYCNKEIDALDNEVLILECTH